MLQILLWHDQVGLKPALPKEMWVMASGIAQEAKSALGLAGKTQQDWIDTVIRIEAVLGWATLMLGQLDQAIGHFLYLIGWYSAAKECGYRTVLRNREDDQLRALSAIVDAGDSPQHQAWISTAGALLKIQHFGQRHINPFRVENVPKTPNGSELDLHLQAAFVSDEWTRALTRLGNESAFIDIIVTDYLVHTRLFLKNSIKPFLSRLKQVNRPAPAGERPRGSFPITSSSCVLDPVVAGRLFDGSEIVKRWHPVENQSELVQWISWFQKVHVHEETDKWKWEVTWEATIPSFEGEMRRVVYASVLGEAVAEAQSRGVNHLIISPDGSLNALPLHLLHDTEGVRLGDKFLMSYAPNLAGLLTVLDIESSQPLSRVVVVEDPSQTVTLAKWECHRVSETFGSSVQLLRGSETTVSSVKEACAGADLVHFSGHASFDWADPDRAYLRLAGDERLTLYEIQELGLRPGALVFLSACHTAGRSISNKRSSSRGIISALFETGAATVICTLWPVHSVAAALISNWFYENWIGSGRGRLESLREATQRLRRITRRECEAIIDRRLYMRGERPFEDEYYWGAFVLYGAW